MKVIPNLKIGNYDFNPPIIQGGMGVKISTATLAAAVSEEGGLGVIASVGLGETLAHLKNLSYQERSLKAMKEQIEEVRRLTSKPFGINIMFVLSNYEDLVKLCVQEEVPFIISGAGLPLPAPGMIKGSKTKVIPIVSSVKALHVLFHYWMKKFEYRPPAVIVEGPMAGGHLGYKPEELDGSIVFDDIVKSIVNAVRETYKLDIPVIAAGGIFDGKDIKRYLDMGCGGVQMATRFVCTDECDVSPKFKEAYLNAKKEDVVIIKSPVGMPGRVLNNKFVQQINNMTESFECEYQCLKICHFDECHYCIGNALLRSVTGDVDNGLIMCGSNVYRIDKIVSVKELMQELKDGILSA